MARALALVALLLLGHVPARAADTPALWEAAGVSRAPGPVDAPRFGLPDLDGRRTGLEACRDRGPALLLDHVVTGLHEYRAPALLDRRGDVADLYEVRATPTVEPAGRALLDAVLRR